MSVEVAQNDGVLPVESLEKRIEVEAMARRAGGDGRHIDVDDCRRFVFNDDGEGEKLD